MGAIPEVDPDEPVETKPFKFVTGKSTQTPLSPMKLGVNYPAAESMANISAAGAYIYPIFPVIRTRARDTVSEGPLPIGTGIWAN